MAGHLEVCEAVAAKGPDVIGIKHPACPWNHEGAHFFAPFGVRRSDHRSFGDRWVQDEDFLDLTQETTR